MIYRLKRSFSKGNLHLLHKLCTEQLNIKPITVYSGQIDIIRDPVDFYITLNQGVSSATKRIGLSSLYLGTGALERFLLDSLKKNMQNNQKLQTRMIFDYSRSMRNEGGQSGVDMVTSLHNQLDEWGRKRLRAGYLKSRKVGRLVNFQTITGVLGQVVGVHHMKLYVFDDDVIVSGANLSHSYFTYRQDRYLHFRRCPQLANYAYDLLDLMIDGAHRLDGQTRRLHREKHDDLRRYFKLWKFANRPQETMENSQAYCENQQNNTKSQPSSQPKPQQQSTTSNSLIQQKRLKKQNLRQRLSKQKQEVKLASVIHSLTVELKNKQSQIVELGQKVTLFPVTQINMVDDQTDRTVITQVLKQNVEAGNQLYISSGYMNFPHFIVDILKDSKVPIPVLTSAPQANSFFEGGRIKRYIPYYYRCYEARLLRTVGKTIRMMEYKRWLWTFHTKGIWITQPNGDMVTIVGSSNFNMRSYQRDTQFQLYIHSSCPNFNRRLKDQWQNLCKDCKQQTLDTIQSDKQMKLGWGVRLFSALFKRFM